MGEALSTAVTVLMVSVTVRVVVALVFRFSKLWLPAFVTLMVWVSPSRNTSTLWATNGAVVAVVASLAKLRVWPLLRVTVNAWPAGWLRVPVMVVSPPSCTALPARVSVTGSPPFGVPGVPGLPGVPGSSVICRVTGSPLTRFSKTWVPAPCSVMPVMAMLGALLPT
ncbi:hypothetical protein D9M73_204700 [compost metagenome]